ncbi:hypothetical protein IG631_15837 [Alternaria alternata]|nr:hypothetical protein IG631_15837 [Alternaria alternata]
MAIWEHRSTIRSFHKSEYETARRQGNPTHCREQERAKQQCADSSTASGGGYPLAPPRSLQGSKLRRLNRTWVPLFVLCGGTTTCS